jgi:hypothetical protein
MTGKADDLLDEPERRTAVVARKRPSQALGDDRLLRVDGLNRSRGRGFGLTLEVRERPVTGLYVGE